MFFYKFQWPFIFMFITFYSRICYSSEFVPVYMWETQNIDQPIPALQRISESSFKDSLLKKLKNNPLVVVFAEETLSPEDFAQHDHNGKTSYTALHKFLQTSNGAYKPYVQNPIGAIKQLNKGVTEVSIASLLRNIDVPKNDVLVVDLNDAKEDEQRSNMLRRHDNAISKVFNKLIEDHVNILAIYTAHRPSWIIPDEVRHRSARSLLQQNLTEAVNEEKKPVPLESGLKEGLTGGNSPVKGLITDKPHLLLYVSSTPKISSNGGESFKQVDLKTVTCEKQGQNIDLTLSGDGYTFNFIIALRNDGYWKLTNLSSGEEKFKVPDISAAIGFSYHCFDVSFSNKKEILILPGIQIQPFPVEKNNHVFGDPYDCVGFTTIPIWSGIIVTIILLLILTLGITFMMDIRTMDKFDDAKGKTITINVSE